MKSFSVRSDEFGWWGQTDQPKSNIFFLCDSYWMWPCIEKAQYFSIRKLWVFFKEDFHTQIAAVENTSLHWVSDFSLKTQNQ